jgi:tetratricopeptide (TPR) repeat protein
MRAAAEFIAKQGDFRFISTCAPFTLVYGDTGAQPVLPVSFDLIALMYGKHNFRYLVVDYHRYFPNMFIDNTVLLIDQKLKPVFEVEDPAVTFFPLLAECEFYSPNSLFEKFTVDVKAWNQFRHNPSEEDKKIRVYDLSEFFNNYELIDEAANIRLKEGIRLVQEGRFKAALSILQRARKNAVTEPIAKLYIAICHCKMGRPKWAAMTFTQLVRERKLPDELHAVAEKYLLYYRNENPEIQPPENETDK